MARKSKLNLEYFPHIISNGKKISYIRKKHGNDGYATWFTILEELGLADFHYLDLRNEFNDDYSIQLMFLSERCYLEESKLISIIEDLVKLGCFDKELWEKRILWSQEFYDSVQEAWKRRDTKLLTRDEIFILLFGKKKVNENIKEIITEIEVVDKNQKFDFRKSLIEIGVEKNIVDDWLLVRKTKKATNTETSYKRLLSQIKKSGLSPNECITISVEKSWKGFEAEWIKELNISINGKSNREVRTPEQKQQSYINSILGEDNEQFINKSNSGFEDISFDDVQ